LVFTSLGARLGAGRGAAGAAAAAAIARLAPLEVIEPAHQGLVDGAEGSCGLVRVLADLVSNLDELVEARALLQLAAELVDESRQIVSDLLDVFQ